jgi:hypothetical protein
MDLENINWFIEYKPTTNSVSFRDTEVNLTKEDFDTIVLDLPSTISLSFPLNDDYTSFLVQKNVKGKLTLGELLNIIYKFYQTKADPSLLDEIYANDKNLYEELLEEGCEIKYVDAFSGSVCQPDFVGLREENGVFIVDLGPL